MNKSVVSYADTLGCFQSCNTLWRLVFPCSNLPSTWFQMDGSQPTSRYGRPLLQSARARSASPPSTGKARRNSKKDSTPTSSLKGADWLACPRYITAGRAPVRHWAATVPHRVHVRCACCTHTHCASRPHTICSWRAHTGDASGPYRIIVG